MHELITDFRFPHFWNSKKDIELLKNMIIIFFFGNVTPQHPTSTPPL